MRFVLNWFRRNGYEVPVIVPSEDVSPYYRVLWRAASDPETMLEMCLEARDELDDEGVLEDAKPPYKALVGVSEVHDLPMDDPNEGILGEMTRKTARKIFDALTAADALGDETTGPAGRGWFSFLTRGVRGRDPPASSPVFRVENQVTPERAFRLR